MGSLTPRNQTRPDAARRGQTRLRRPQIEALEGRRLLTSFFNVPPGTQPIIWQPATEFLLPPTTPPIPLSLNATVGVPIDNAHIGWEVSIKVDHISVDWGDGSSPGTSLLAPVGDGFNWIEGSHTYSSAGTYLITTRYYDSPDSTAPFWSPVTTTVTVAAPPSTDGANISKAASKAAHPATQAEWSLALPAGEAGTPTVVIHWGGTSKTDRSEQVSVVNGHAYVAASHKYHNHGVHRAVAVFMQNGKKIGRVVLKLAQNVLNNA
jgi:hypothetical protein